MVSPLNLDKLGCALEHKIAFVSEDRKGVGLLLNESIEHNIIFSAMQTNNKFLKRVLWMRLYDKSSQRACAGYGQAAGYPLYGYPAGSRKAFRRQPAKGMSGQGVNPGA